MGFLLAIVGLFFAILDLILRDPQPWLLPVAVILVAAAILVGPVVSFAETHKP